MELRLSPSVSRLCFSAAMAEPDCSRGPCAEVGSDSGLAAIAAALLPMMAALVAYLTLLPWMSLAGISLKEPMKKD
jgi:hypothetical protein